MHMVTTGLVTADEFEHMGELGRYFELDRGVVVPVNPPGYDHGRIAVIIAARLLAFVQRNALGTVLVESGFTLFRDPDTVRGPDVSFVRRERLTLPRRSGWFEGAPDLAVEVRSPEDGLKHLLRKADEYLRSGARLAWVVDPAAKTCMVCRPGREQRTVTAEDALDGEDVLAGFSLPLAELFVDPY